MVALRHDDTPSALIWFLIREYNLHENDVPVDLSPLYDLFVPVSAVGLGLTDFVLMPKGDAPLSTLRPAHVVIADDDDLPWSVRYAHEVAHAVCRHTGTLRLGRVDGWFHDRQEREAWQLAARLLIPTRLIYEGGFSDWTKDHIAAACGVPNWLVDLYPS